jgi:pimeloyl-ACP methyl ester carboxylesterase
MQNPFPGPMQPAPQLAPFERSIHLKYSRARVSYFDAGSADAPAVVLIHGLQDEADTWRHVFAPLAEKHRVIALDLPGFGRSDKTARKYTVQFFVDVVVELMDRLGIHYATLVGNSLGGMIAEVIALQHAARVLRLVLVDGTIAIVKRPATNHSLLTQLFFLPQVDKRNFELLRPNHQLAYDTLLPYYANLPAMPQADRDFLFQRVNERVWDEPQRLASLSVQQQLPRFFIREVGRLARRIPQLPVPTRVIWGECDSILSIDNGKARAALQAGATLHVIPNAGHLPHQEQPRAFLSSFFCQAK